MKEKRKKSRMKHVLALIYVENPSRDNLSRLPGEEVNPLHSPDVADMILLSKYRNK
jgi:hypothetical protein